MELRWMNSQLMRLRRKRLYLLNHLAGPWAGHLFLVMPPHTWQKPVIKATGCSEHGATITLFTTVSSWKEIALVAVI